MWIEVKKNIIDLICDMCTNGATKEELEHVITYSLDILDAQRNGYDWRPLYYAHSISAFEEKYQKSY